MKIEIGLFPILNSISILADSLYIILFVEILYLAQNQYTNNSGYITVLLYFTIPYLISCLLIKSISNSPQTEGILNYLFRFGIHENKILDFGIES